MKNQDPDFGDLRKLRLALLKWALKLRCGHDAEDFVQMTLLAMFANRTQFQRGSSALAWGAMILLNKVRTNHKRAWRSLPLDMAQLAKSAAADNPSTVVELHDVVELMEAYPDLFHSAEVFDAAIGEKYEGIAFLSGIAVNTVKSRVSRGRAALRETFA